LKFTKWLTRAGESLRALGPCSLLIQTHLF